MKTNQNEKEKIVVRHIMADGSERDSIEGYVIPVNEYTEIAYRIMAKWIRDQEALQASR